MELIQVQGEGPLSGDKSTAMSFMKQLAAVTTGTFSAFDDGGSSGTYKAAQRARAARVATCKKNCENVFGEIHVAKVWRGSAPHIPARSRRTAPYSIHEPRVASQSPREVNRETPIRQVVFVIDISGSMDGRFTAKDGHTYTRLQYVQKELAGILRDGLRPAQSFNIIKFASTVESWRPSLVPATSANVQQAS